MAMDFAAARDRARRLIAAKKPSQQSRSALTDDALRDNIVDDAGRDIERFRAARNRKPEIEYEIEQEDGSKEQRRYTWDGYGDAITDVARAGFGFDDPELRRQEDILPSRQINRELLRDLMRSDPFQESRPYTQGNELEAVFGALAASKSLQESAKTRLAEHIARSEDMREQEEQAGCALDALERLRRQARGEIEQDGQVSDQTRRDVKAQVKARQQAREKLYELLSQQAQSSFAQDVSAAANEAAEEAGDAAESFSRLPGLEPGQATNLSPDEQIELAEKWASNDELRKIADMLGRMFARFTQARAGRSKNVPVEPVGVTTGRHLERLLPQELATAFNPKLRPAFIKRFVEHSLLEWEMTGTEPLSHGPIIAVHDGSGSMSGGNFVLATSVGLTLLKHAQRDNRAFAGVEFGSPGQMKSWLFPKGVAPDANEIVDYSSHFFGGGTDIETGMREALRIMREQAGFDSADVVLISDGADFFEAGDQEIRDELNGMGVRIHGITIDCAPNAYFEQMTEWYTDIVDVTDASAAVDMLGENIT